MEEKNQTTPFLPLTTQSHLDLGWADEEDVDVESDIELPGVRDEQQLHSQRTYTTKSLEENDENEESTDVGEDFPCEEREFARAMELIVVSAAQPQSALDLLSAFHAICTQRLQTIERTLNTSQQPDQSVSRLRLQQEADLLRAERSTWSLLHGLLHERFSFNHETKTHTLNSSHTLTSSESQIAHQLLLTVPALRRLQVVVAWLEREYALRRKELRRTSNVMTEPATWHRTLTQWKLQSKKKNGQTQQQQPQRYAHPDWFIRSKLLTHNLDQELDAELCAQLWTALRCGRLFHSTFHQDESDKRANELQSQFLTAHDLALTAGQPWRAASLLGAFPTHDPFLSLSSSSSTQTLPEHNFISGNPYRSLFRKTAYLITSMKHSDLNIHERALYGALCGNLDAMLAACENWEDHLWAHCKVALDRRLELELSAYRSSLLVEEEEEEEKEEDDTNDDEQDVVPEQIEKNDKRMKVSSSAPPQTNTSSSLSPHLELRDILDRLRMSPLAEVRQAAATPYHQIQAWILTDDWTTLTHQLAQWVTHQNVDKSTSSSSLLRFATHLIHLLTALEFLPPLSTENETLHRSLTLIRSAYIEHLITTQQFSLVALYTSQLPRELQVPVYADFLRRLDAVKEGLRREHREEALRRAAHYGLDVDAITAHLVTRLLNSTPSDFSRPSTSHGSVSTDRERSFLSSSAVVAKTTTFALSPTLHDRSTQMSSVQEEETSLSPSVRAQLTSLEWLCVAPTQRVETLLHANALVRQFLLHDNLRAAQEVFHSLERCLRPSSTNLPTESKKFVTSSISHEEVGPLLSTTVVESGQLPLLLDIPLDDPRPLVQDAIREHVALYNYLQAVQAIQQWTRHHAQRPPAPPPSPVDTSYATSLAHAREVQRYTAEHANWLAEDQRLSDIAQRAIYRVLLFPHGWLRDKNTTPSQTTDTTLTPTHSISSSPFQVGRTTRQQELEALRRQCAPGLFFALHRVLHETGPQADLCLQLAHLLVDPKYLWWTCFTREDLQQMLALFRLSALHLLDTKGDPLPQ